MSVKTTGLEWQFAEGSTTAHAIDIDLPDNMVSGRRALCGRYPQRRRGSWFALSIHEPNILRAVQFYGKPCADCLHKVREKYL